MTAARADGPAGIRRGAAAGAPSRRVPPSAVAVPERKKAAEVIADHFRRDIATGALRDGDTLPPEGELIAHFGVSRPTLRAALRLLESESLLTISRGAKGGPQVRHPDANVTARNVAMLLHLRATQLSDFFQMRATIEPAAAAIFARDRPADGIAVLEAALAGEEEAMRTGAEGEWLAATVAFYRAVTDNCGSDLFAVFGAVLQILLAEAIRYVREFLPGSQVRVLRSDVHAVHRELVDLIVAGDVEGAERHWRSHLGSLVVAFPELQAIRYSAY